MKIHVLGRQIIARREISLLGVSWGLALDDVALSINGWISRLVLGDLDLDPVAGLLESFSQGGSWSPSQDFLDQVVVAVSSADSLWSRDVLDWKSLLSGISESQVGHLVHGDHLVRSDVEWLGVVGAHQTQNSLNAIVDVAEGSSLESVSPHLELSGGGQSLAAEGSWGLLSSSLPGSLWSVDVVEAGYAHLDAEVLLVMHAELLGDQLLETVGVLWESWPGILLLESWVVGLELLILRVDASRRRVEESLDSVNASGLKHVEGDHGVVVQDDRMVRLDESHSSHIGGEVEDPLAVLGDFEAVIVLAEIDKLELIAELLGGEVEILAPVGSDDIMSFLLQSLGDVGSNETSSSSNADSHVS